MRLLGGAIAAPPLTARKCRWKRLVTSVLSHRTVAATGEKQAKPDGR
jgi:hypothetical protein